MGEHSIKVDHPNVSPGQPIEIPSVGLVENGSTVDVELDDERADELSRAYGVYVDGKNNYPSSEQPVEEIVNTGLDGEKEVTERDD